LAPPKKTLSRFQPEVQPNGVHANLVRRMRSREQHDPTMSPDARREAGFNQRDAP
jgi:hypothetical protein